LARKKKELDPIKPSFKKILVANRGEIACRIMRTCERLGIKTVGIYSDADRHSLHVKVADEAIRVGKAPASESYLNIKSIIRAAKRSGAEAIHPGYGFLSENSDFADACGKAGIVFIGPSARVMNLMKDKVQARRLASEAGLPLLPGSDGIVTDEDASSTARNIGFPVMLKASSGGGGIGIRLIHNEDELPENLKRARSLAESSFGNSEMYIEKYLEHPSHIEVQVLADNYGNAFHLFERDCSVQRRNQKIIEEAPARKLSKRQRKKMCQAALKLVRHLDYTNAGTVEFMLDQSGDFYFLEMNTRLQVEHPVTEMITGLDVVEQQIQIAANKPLTWDQDDIKTRGHSIEARIYPEDPVTFIPFTGTINKIVEPTKNNVRIDSGVSSGQEISSYYDPLISKVIVWAKSRKLAISTLIEALNDYHIEGIVNNIPVIRDVLQDDVFKDNKYSTHILRRLSEDTNRVLSPLEEREATAAVAVALGTLFGNGQTRRSNAWKAYGRSMQMAPRADRGILW
jgi:acetyl-CoA carboxylase biotin carboxylase subunit